MVSVGSLVYSVKLGTHQTAQPGVMVLAYMFSAMFWLTASFAAELATPGRSLTFPNMANAVAASLAAVGTMAGVDQGWSKISTMF